LRVRGRDGLEERQRVLKLFPGRREVLLAFVKASQTRAQIREISANQNAPGIFGSKSLADRDRLRVGLLRSGGIEILDRLSHEIQVLVEAAADLAILGVVG